MASKESNSNSTSQTGQSSDDFLSSIIPGYKGLASSATGIIGNLLNGTPSTSTTRNAAATFAAGNGQGQGGSGNLADRWGYDLYNQKGQQNQQTGIANLLSMVQGVSSPVLTNQGQQMQNNQFNANLGQQSSQFGQNMQLQKFLANLQAVGLGNTISNSGNQSAPQFNF